MRSARRRVSDEGKTATGYVRYVKRRSDDAEKCQADQAADRDAELHLRAKGWDRDEGVGDVPARWRRVSAGRANLNYNLLCF